MRMNTLCLIAELRKQCHNEIDHQIVNAIMSAYNQLSGFYEEHAFEALKVFQEKSVLILNVSELNELLSYDVIDCGDDD